MSYQPSNRTILISLDTPYLQSPFSDKSSLKTGLSFESIPSRTRQEFASECDINTIMARYLRTGEMPHVNLLAPQYFDAPGVDFQTHMNAIAEAKSLFAQLPSDIRNRFYNDPGQFVDFCSDPSNRKELATMGLLSPEATRQVLYPSPPTDTSTKAPTAPSTPPPAAAPSPADGS
ncbi:MAG: internal scaffolding protein [Microviridae sp.]|nr:MAG: internal scaffolding protein [Microviridae sp.]